MQKKCSGNNRIILTVASELIVILILGSLHMKGQGFNKFSLSLSSRLTNKPIMSSCMMCRDNAQQGGSTSSLLLHVTVVHSPKIQRGGAHCSG